MSRESWNRFLNGPVRISAHSTSMVLLMSSVPDDFRGLIVTRALKTSGSSIFSELI